MLEAFRNVKQQKTPDLNLNPAFWDKLTSEDKVEFYNLKNRFHQSLNSSGKDRRVVTFANELMSVLKYIDRDMVHREERAILTGICFAGPFICVNTRQLKTFLGRCKSSINGSFQQMGYIALRTKAKSRNCIVSILKPLVNEQNILRQWTVRCASENTDFCYLSSFSVSQLPEITEADLYDEKSAPSQQRNQQNPLAAIDKKMGLNHDNLSKQIQGRNIASQYSTSIPQRSSSTNISQKKTTFSNKVTNIGSNNKVISVENMELKNEKKNLSMSYSLDHLSFYEDSDWEFHSIDNLAVAATEDWENHMTKMTRSVSAGLDITGDWSSLNSTDYRELFEF